MVRKVLVAALVAVARAASNDAGAPVPFAEFAAPADKADGAAEGRMQQMFQDVRRLQYSYDFASTCVSSLMACVSDADCADDEVCFGVYEAVFNARRVVRANRREKSCRGGLGLQRGT